MIACLTLRLSPFMAVGALVGLTMLVGLLWFVGWAWMGRYR